MKADVIEIAARRSTENISGAYIAVWSLGQKMVTALALGLCHFLNGSGLIQRYKWPC